MEMFLEDKKELKVVFTHYAARVLGLLGRERVLNCVAAVL